MTMAVARTLFLGATAGLAMLAVGGLSPILAAEEEVNNPHAGDPTAVARGSELYSARCGFCHGGRGRGAKGPALTSGHFKRGGGSDLVLFSIIATGVPNTQMGAFGGSLTADEIWDIITFIRDETKKRQDSGEIPRS